MSQHYHRGASLPTTTTTTAMAIDVTSASEQERPALSPVAIKKPRHYGYDNCKVVFMILVVLWHTFHMSILEATLVWGSRSDGDTTTAGVNEANTTTNEELGNFWKRAEDRRLVHHSSWTPFLIRLVVRYCLWGEKIAVPGFCFLSGYFSKGFLKQPPVPRPTRAMQSSPNTEAMQQHYHELQTHLTKDRIRWEKTIVTLLVGPLLWQMVTGLIGFLVTSWAHREWAWKDKTVVCSQIEWWDNLQTWYLFALLIWRMWTTLFLARLAPPPRQKNGRAAMGGLRVFGLSLVLSFVSTHTNWGGPLELRIRLFYFFPFYVAGLYWEESLWEQVVSGVWSSGRRVFAHPWLSAVGCFRHNNYNPQDATAASSSNKQNNYDPETVLDRRSRIVGACGIAATLLLVHWVPERTDLGWMYHLDTYELRPHMVLFCQYVGSLLAVVSVILVVKTIRWPLLPWGHANSTLAIYEWHWPLANFLAWGNLPFAWVSTAETSLSWVQWWFATLSPWTLWLVAHGSCYLICVLLGSRLVWDKILRHVSDPQWVVPNLFSMTPRETEQKGSSSPKTTPQRKPLSLSINSDIP